MRLFENLPLFLRPPFPVLRRVVRGSTFFALLVAIEFAYFFFVTAGTFHNWPTYNELFDALAEGFRAGHLYLPFDPPAELLAKPNPLDPANVDLWFPDLSLYKGKYYIYWGPLPALGIWVAKWFFEIRKTVGDQYPCFALYSVYLIAGALLLKRVATRLFPGLPHYLLLIAIAVFALASPTPFLVSTPGIYEAAIAGAQAFLLLGLVFAFDALGGVRRWSRLRLVAAGAAWSLALTCRVSAGPAVFCIALITALVPPQSGRRWLAALRDFALMSAPIVVTVAGLLYYNKARFDSWLEFGTGVQLNTMHYRGAREYLSPNLYSYFLRWPKLECTFPFTTAPWDLTAAAAFPEQFNIPEGYWIQEPVAGMFRVVPWVWLFPLAFVFALERVSPRFAPVVPTRGATRGVWFWCISVFSVLAFVTALPFIATFGATMRYLGDITPGFVFLATLGGFALYHRIRRRKWLRRGYGSLLAVLGVSSVVLGLLMGFQGYNGHFQLYNPRLHEKLIKKYSRCS
ncbi:MAG: hypothetical protein ABW133_13060 [Polyangiaceae bacterium]